MMHFTGLQGQKSRLFGINNPNGGGLHVLIFISDLKLDIANQTVVLDSAVLPLTDQLVPRIRPFLAELSGTNLCHIKVGANELRLWRQVLPAMVERSRTWQHRVNCEYLTESRIPLSMQNGQTLLCSCGNGQLPAKFINCVPQWVLISKHFVRAALSPCFPTAFSEQLFDFSRIGKIDKSPPSGACRACGKDKFGNGASLSVCGNCRKVRYCSAKCQRADWKKHKIKCEKPELK